VSVLDLREVRMRKGSIIVILMVSVSVFNVSIVFLPENVRGGTLFVGGIGPGNFTTIKGAVAAANPGDTVFVYNGTYVENVPIFTPISLIGENRDTTIIDANLNGNALWLEADWVNVSDLTVTRSKGGTSGVAFHYAENCTVENLNIIANAYGIKAEWSHNNTVMGTNMTSNGIGIYLWESNDNVIQDTHAATSTFEGMRVTRSNNNTLQNGSVVSGVRRGVLITESFGNAFTGNSISSNNEGFIILASANISITHNTIYTNTLDGINISGSRNTTISDNIISDNYIPLYIFDSGSLIITDNDFTNNQAGLILRNLQRSRLDGNNVSFNTHHGIDMRSSENNTISNSTVSANGEMGLRLSNSNYNVIADNDISLNNYGLDLRGGDHTTIRGNEITLSNFDGIYNIFSHNNVITNNSFSQNRFNGTSIVTSENITFTQNVMVGEGLTITGVDVADWDSHTIETSNTVNGKPVYYWKDTIGGTAPLDAGQMIVVDSDDILIEELDASNTSIGIQVAYSSDTIIANNTANSNTCSGIVTSYSTRSTIIDNVAESNGFAGIYLYTSTFSVVRNNYVPLNGAYGIFLQLSHANTISTNVAGSSVVGLYLKHSDNNTAVHNDVNDSDYGIYTFQSSNNIITDSNLTANGEGITLYSGHSSNISDNEILWSADYSIYLRTSNDNTITGNSVLSSGYGAYLYFSQDNVIYHNDFINNLNQAHDDFSSNFWDDGYPSGGNYWSDYAGLDEKSGIAQNQPGSDGIGDWPYFIDGGANQDTYPLMIPYSPPILVPPTAPQTLQATSGNQQIALTWVAPVSDGGSPITNYRIYRGTTSGGETYLTEISNLLDFTDTGLVNGQTYYYWVTAVNAVGEGPQSNEASSVPGNVPGAPTGLNAVAGNGEVSLTWTTPSDDGGFPITDFMIYRGTTSGGETFIVMIGNVNGYTDTGLTNGQDYFYKVSAKNSIGEGPLSNEATATPIGPQANQPPTCEITSPTSQDSLSGVYTAIGLADDPDGTVTLVQIRIDDGGWIQAEGLTSWSYSWNTSNASDGEHTIYARSFDGTDYSNEAVVLAIVDNGSPQEPDDDEPDDGVFWWVAAIILLIVALIAITWLALTFRKRESKGKENSD
jgi:parallel beta-helix repeat protein